MLKWTSEPPQEPGWYWLRYEGRIEVAKVYHADGDWCCQFAGDNGAWLLSENAEDWAGPIPKPTENA